MTMAESIWGTAFCCAEYTNGCLPRVEHCVWGQTQGSI